MMMEVKTEITGSVWKVLASPGSRVAAGEPIMLLESMKMEIPVLAPEAGVVETVQVQASEVVQEGQVVATLQIG